MTRSIKAVLALAAVSLVAAAGALAASPIKGATYTGKVSGTETKVKLKVSSTGKRLTFVLSCYGTEAVRVKGVKIKDGKFSAVRPYFEVRGRFAKRRKAKGSISGNACFLQGESSWRATKR